MTKSWCNKHTVFCAQGMDSETMITIYICCHLIGMASTVFNPVMYGYRNEHLRHDALQVSRFLPAAKPRRSYRGPILLSSSVSSNPEFL